MVDWSVGSYVDGERGGGGGSICHEEERKGYFAGNLEYGISGGRPKGKERLFLFYFIGEGSFFLVFVLGGGGWGGRVGKSGLGLCLDRWKEACYASFLFSPM